MLYYTIDDCYYLIRSNLFAFMFLLCFHCYSQTLQHVLCTGAEDSPQTNPIIGRIDRKSGHGAGRPTQKLVCATASLNIADSKFNNLCDILPLISD